MCAGVTAQRATRSRARDVLDLGQRSRDVTVLSGKTGGVDDAEILSGGSTHGGRIVRIGDKVHRPRTAGAELVESFLVHLEQVGFDAAPRFRGIDELGRQILTFVDGEATDEPPWLHDEDRNRAHLVAVARLLRRLHEAGEGFAAPPGAVPRRTCPAPGATWLHGDVHYGNLVFRSGLPVALLDWDFAMAGDPLYDVVTLLFSSRCPRLDLPDEFEARATSARRTLAALLDAYGANGEQQSRAPSVAAAMSDGAADYLVEIGIENFGERTVAEFEEEVARRRFLADWWRQQTAT